MIKIALILLIFTPQKEDFRKIFGEHYVSSVEYVSSRENNIDSLAAEYKINENVLTAIIFPELIRYSIIRDFIESNTLEIVYVNTGLADYSIGPLQIKPSFAVKIENLVKNDGYFKNLSDEFTYKTDIEVEVRKQRLQRLKDFRSQLRYVGAFQKYMYRKFSWLEEQSIEYQVKFLSTAYNYNFMASRVDIEEYMERAFFPWGAHNNRKKYNYADISWYYFNEQYN